MERDDGVIVVRLNYDGHYVDLCKRDNKFGSVKYDCPVEEFINKKKDEESKPEVGPVQDGMEWFEWQDKFRMLLNTIPSVGVD